MPPPPAPPPITCAFIVSAAPPKRGGGNSSNRRADEEAKYRALGRTTRDIRRTLIHFPERGKTISLSLQHTFHVSIAAENRSAMRERAAFSTH